MAAFPLNNVAAFPLDDGNCQIDAEEYAITINVRKMYCQWLGTTCPGCFETINICALLCHHFQRMCVGTYDEASHTYDGPYTLLALGDGRKYQRCQDLPTHYALDYALDIMRLIGVAFLFLSVLVSYTGLPSPYCLHFMRVSFLVCTS